MHTRRELIIPLPWGFLVQKDQFTTSRTRLADLPPLAQAQKPLGLDCVKNLLYVVLFQLLESGVNLSLVLQTFGNLALKLGILLLDLVKVADEL